MEWAGLKKAEQLNKNSFQWGQWVGGWGWMRGKTPSHCTVEGLCFCYHGNEAQSRRVPAVVRVRLIFCVSTSRLERHLQPPPQLHHRPRTSSGMLYLA